MISLLFLIIPALFAQEKVLKYEAYTHTEFADPDLKSFRIRVEHKELKYANAQGRPYYITKMVADIAVHDTKNLKNYAVVQFNRGCHFNSYKNKQGPVFYSVNSTRQYFDEDISHKHPTWVLDSVDKDPIYWSSYSEEYGRLEKYRLNDPMVSQTSVKPVYMKSGHRNQTISYVRDMPTGATELDRGAFTNSAFEFRTCVYKVTDLPATTTPEAPELYGKELKCFEWKNNFIYNYALKTYEMTSQIHPYCLE